MPRDLRMYMARLRSPPNSRSRNNSQVSTIEEMSTSVFSGASSPGVKLVKRAVIRCIFKKSISRSQHGSRVLTISRLDQAADRIEDDYLGLELLDQFVKYRQVHLQAMECGPDGVEAEQVFLNPRLQVHANRAHVADDLVRRLFEREVQAGLAARARRVREMRGDTGLAGTRRPGHQYAAAAEIPSPPSMVSSPAMPVEIRSSVASCCKPSEVIGNTLMPSSSIRNGYSFVPCVVPRYLTMRSRRVDTWSITRWSSRITQSETYSSKPCRVSWPSPRSPVMTAVTPLSLSQRNRRRSSARKMAAFDRPLNSVSMVSSTTRLAPIAVDGVVQANKQSFEVVVAGFFDLVAFDPHEVHGQFFPLDEFIQIEAERPDVLSEFFDGFLKGHEHARLVVLHGPVGPGTPWRATSCRSPQSRRRG